MAESIVFEGVVTAWKQLRTAENNLTGLGPGKIIAKLPEKVRFIHDTCGTTWETMGFQMTARGLHVECPTCKRLGILPREDYEAQK